MLQLKFLCARNDKVFFASVASGGKTEVCPWQRACVHDSLGCRCFSWWRDGGGVTDADAVCSMILKCLIEKRAIFHHVLGVRQV